MDTVAAGLLTCAPIDAGAVSITGASTAWADSSWVEVVAALAQDSVLLGLAVSHGVGNQHEYDIGVGAAGAETVIATIRAAANAVAQVGQLILPVPYGPVAAGARVAVRVRRDTTSTTATTVKLLYVAGNPDTVTKTTAVLQSIPSAAAGLTVSAVSTDWANGAWVEFAASTAAAWVLGGLVVRQSAFATAVMEVDVGVGAAGAETVVYTFRWSAGSNFVFPSVIPAWPPAAVIAPGQRVALRARGTEVGGFRMALQYYESTL